MARYKRNYKILNLVLGKYVIDGANEATPSTVEDENHFKGCVRYWNKNSTYFTRANIHENCQEEDFELISIEIEEK